VITSCRSDGACSDGIEIRSARSEEYHRVGRLIVDAYRLLEVDHLWGGYEAEILDTATRANHAEVLVAVADGRVVGAVTFVGASDSQWSEWTEPGEAQFRLLAVDAGARGQGIGEQLVRGSASCVPPGATSPMSSGTIRRSPTCSRSGSASPSSPTCGGATKTAQSHCALSDEGRRSATRQSDWQFARQARS
jgi:GNAT superfamily N-acetyltransferase